MTWQSVERVVLVTVLALAAGTPVAAQNPWIADGGYYEQFDSPPGKFTPHVMRWVWTSHFEPGAVEDFVAYFDCWRAGDEGGIGSNKVVVRWTLTDPETDTVIKLKKWKKKLENGSFDSQTRVINEIAPLAAAPMVLVEARISIKGTVGAGEYVGCDMDLSEHPDGFDGNFEARARR